MSQGRIRSIPRVSWFALQRALRAESAELRLAAKEFESRVRTLEKENEGLRDMLNLTGANTETFTPMRSNVVATGPAPASPGAALPGAARRAPPAARTQWEHRVAALERENRDLRAAGAALRVQVRLRRRTTPHNSAPHHTTQ